MGLEDVLFILSYAVETDQIKWCGTIIFGLDAENLKAQRFENVWIEATSDG